MKKKIFLAALALLVLDGKAVADGQQTVIIGGQCMEQKATRLTFGGDDVTVTFADGSTQTADMEAVTIELEWDNVATAVEHVQQEHGGASPAAGIYYDLQGRKVSSGNRQQGLLIVHQGGKTSKIVKR